MRLTHPDGEETIDLDTVDLVDPVLHAEGDPHAIWLAMRTHDPVRWQQVQPDLGFWSATTYDDVATVLRDHTAFTSEHGTLLNLLGRRSPSRHAGTRSPMARALTDRVVEGHRDVIRDEVARLLATVVDGEPFDFAELTGQLPMAVTGTLLGLDRDDWPHLTFLVNQALAPEDPEFVGPEGHRSTLDSKHLFASLREAMIRRESNGATDLIDMMCTRGIADGEPLRAAEIVSNCLSLLLGATVTAPHVPNAAVLELAANGTYADWADHPELLHDGIEEALRWSSPASHSIRYATHDVALGRITIREGDPVVAWVGSANRDADVFPNPYTFDVRRNAARHLALGVGPHYCLGHTLVRVTLEEFFGEFFARFEHIELGGEPEHLRSNVIAGIKHLPLVATRRDTAWIGHR